MNKEKVSAKSRDFSKIEDGALEDSGPITNYGILIDDYKIKYEENPLDIQVTKPTIRAKIGKKDKGKAY